MGLMMVAEGHNGSIELHDDRVVVKHGGLMGFITTGFTGDKTVMIDQISSLDFKDSSLLTGFGYLRLNFPGAETVRGGISQVAYDENAVTFRGGHRESFVRMRDAINEKVQEARSARQGRAASKPSDADELTKYASLLEKGFITPDEFNAKKKQILGL